MQVKGKICPKDIIFAKAYINPRPSLWLPYAVPWVLARSSRSVVSANIIICVISNTCGCQAIQCSLNKPGPRNPMGQTHTPMFLHNTLCYLWALVKRPWKHLICMSACQASLLPCEHQNNTDQRALQVLVTPPKKDVGPHPAAGSNNMSEDTIVD